MDLSVHFLSKWRDAPFRTFLSIFHESTPHCNGWRLVEVRCRYVNSGINGAAVSFCIQMTDSLGHLTLASQRSTVGRLGVLFATIFQLHLIIFYRKGNGTKLVNGGAWFKSFLENHRCCLQKLKKMIIL